MNILAVDLGTKTGFAYNRGAELSVGTWELATKKEITAWGKMRLTRRKDPRVDRLCRNLADLGTFDVVIFEDVEFIKYQKQAQLWASLRTALWQCADGILFECVPVTTLKKFATGSGKATKEAMAKFLTGIDHKGRDDNAVDAIWLWQWAKVNLTRTKL